MHRIATRWSRTMLVLAALLLQSCAQQEQPTAPALSAGGEWPTQLVEALQLPDGTWQWSWRSEDQNTRAATGSALLSTRGTHFRWTLRGVCGDVAEHGLTLVPEDTFWLSIQVPQISELALTPPLPRLAIDSAAYPDLVAMLRDLMTPRFNAVITHWPEYPVPVSSPTAVSGAVDLEACLREAVEIWNSNEPEPHFVWQPGAAWGVRLAFYDGSIRRPPLMIQATRRDAEGRPLAMRISAGNNYSSATTQPYAVRGMAHELAHAMLLWGHTPDRQHLLWGDLPPLRSDPSADERRAVRLLRSLPAGLDLKRYGQVTEP